MGSGLNQVLSQGSPTFAVRTPCFSQQEELTPLELTGVATSGQRASVAGGHGFMVFAPQKLLFPGSH